MKIDFDIDYNAFLLDIKASLFVALLKMELKDSKEALPEFKHPDDIKMYKANIKACKQLLDYYGVQDGRP